MCLLFFFSTMMWRLGLAWVRGVYGAVERRHAAPAVVGRLGLVLDKEPRFWASGRMNGRRTDETGLPPFFSSNRKPQRNSDFDFRFLRFQ